jgi:hypothetical protein
MKPGAAYGPPFFALKGDQMPTERQIDAATDAYLKARGWDDETIRRHEATRAEVRERMMAALKAAEDVENQS